MSSRAQEGAEQKTKVTHYARRYSEAQQKSLDLLHHSKTVFNYTTQIEDDEILLRIFQGVGTKPRGSDGIKIETAFEAAQEGALPRLKRFIEKEGFDPRSHDDANGGSTVLHYAAWGGNVAVLQYLIHYMRATYGEEELVHFVNIVDTVYNRSTALIEACRSNIGIVSDRLECIRDLIDAGADPNMADSSGNNALHVAVQNSSLPVVRYLTNHTKRALLASTATNGRVQRPIDIAASKCGLKPPNYDQQTNASFMQLEIFKLLQSLLIRSNLRLKINALGDRRAQRISRLSELRERELEDIKKRITAMSNRSWEMWDDQRKQASKLRTQEQEIIRQATQEQLPAHFEQYVTTNACQTSLKKLHSKGMSEDAALEKLRAQHAAERTRQVEEHFATNNPPCADWEEYLRRIDSAKRR